MPDPAQVASPYWATVDGTGTPVSSRFLAMLASSDQTSITRVDVYNGSTLIQTLPGVTSGSVTVDRTATTRRTCTLTLSSKGRDLDNLVPKSVGDLLHPSTGNELHIYRGFQYPDGSQDLCQLGVFRMSKPQVTDTGASITIQINGSDRSAYISRIKWTGPYSIIQGTDLSTAVRLLIANRWLPSVLLTYSMTPTNPIPAGYPNAGQYLAVPATTFGLDLVGANDPWNDAVGLCAAGGQELLFDVYGNLVMHPMSTTGTSAPVFLTLYEEGPTNTYDQIGITLDETGTFNGVVAIGNGAVTGVVPVKSQSVSNANAQTYSGVWNQTIGSDTYYDPGAPTASRWGPVPFMFQTTAIPGYQTVPFLGTTTISNATITGITTLAGGAGGTTGIVDGGPITGPNIPLGTTITSHTSTTIVMTQNATATATGVEIIGPGAADTQAQAQSKIDSVAGSLLATLMSLLDQNTLNAICNPAAADGDVVILTRERIGVVGASRLIQAVTIPLDPITSMSVVTVPSSEAA